MAPSKRPSSDRVLARWLAATVVGLGLLQAANNTLPYFGLRDDSCQTMFSGLAWRDGWNNHAFMPQVMLSDLWVYYIEVEVDVDPPPPPGRLTALHDWLARDDIQHNAEAVRVAVGQLCEAGHAVRMSYRPVHGDARHGVDACADPRLSEAHDGIPVRLYDSHYPWPWPPVDPDATGVAQ